MHPPSLSSHPPSRSYPFPLFLLPLAPAVPNGEELAFCALAGGYRLTVKPQILGAGGAAARVRVGRFLVTNGYGSARLGCTVVAPPQMMLTTGAREYVREELARTHTYPTAHPAPPSTAQQPLPHHCL